MGQLTAFGGVSKTIFLNDAGAGVLHLAFSVAAAQTVKRGQPMKMAANGTITPLIGDGTDAHHIVGYSIHNGVAGDEVTLACRGFAVVFATAETALTPGPVWYSGQDSVDADYSMYDDTAATAANMNGIAIDTAAALHDVIRVILL